VSETVTELLGSVASYEQLRLSACSDEQQAAELSFEDRQRLDWYCA
jgi:hypothetical protein